MTRRGRRPLSKPRDGRTDVSRSEPRTRNPEPETQTARNPYAAWIVLAAVAVVTLIVRLRLAGVPLERDEGEYAYAGQLILHGYPPYALAYNMKFPGTYYAYALILAVFGPSPWGIHVGLIILNLSTAAVIWRIGVRVIGSLAGALAAACFLILSLDRGVLGVFAHATHFVLLPALAGLFVLIRSRARRPGATLAAGVLLGLAALMKQQGVFFLPLGVAIAASDFSETNLVRHRVGRARRAGLVLAGAALPLAALCLVLLVQSVLGRFWFWTIDYARAYVGVVPLDRAWSIFATEWAHVAGHTMAIWVVAAAGGLTLWLTSWPPQCRFVLTGLAVAGLAAITPGFYFREHYWILMLPAVSLCAGVAAAAAERVLTRVWRARGMAALIVSASAAVIFVAYAAAQWTYCFVTTPVALSRELFGPNPFPEAAGIARYIHDRTGPGGRIAVLGSEPEIYFYADRASATGYIYMYPFMESQPFAAPMQREMTQEIVAARPAYLVLVSVPTSWSDGQFSMPPILRWSQAYTKQCYDLVGIADIGESRTTMVWDRDAAMYQPASPNVILTFKRRVPAPCGTPLN